MKEIFSKIELERARQFDLPGTEHDVQKEPNDWIVTTTRILCEAQTVSGVPPTAENFQKSMIKAAAVIVAAIEHIDLMTEKNRLV